MKSSIFRYAYAAVMIVVSFLIFIKANQHQKDLDLQQLQLAEYNSSCIVNYELEGAAVRPERDTHAGMHAIQAAAGLLDLESDYFEIRSDCVNRSGKIKSALTVRYVVLDSSGWSRSKLIDASRQANAVLGQCGIHLEDIAVNFVAVNASYNSVDSIEYFQLVNSTRDSSEITIYFINEQTLSADKLWGLAYNQGFSRWYELRPQELKRFADTGARLRPGVLDNVALIVGNHTQRGQSHYVWRTLGLGRTIAHELYHILGDCRCHENSDRKNFMFPGGGYRAIGVNPEQCRTALAGVGRLRAQENLRIMTFDETE